MGLWASRISHQGLLGPQDTAMYDYSNDFENERFRQNRHALLLRPLHHLDDDPDGEVFEEDYDGDIGDMICNDIDAISSYLDDTEDRDESGRAVPPSSITRLFWERMDEMDDFDGF